MLDPNDKSAILNQYEITFARNVRGKEFEMTDFCPIILDKIYEYISFKDTLTMRCVCRSFLLHHIISSRARLYQRLWPRIQSGYDCLHESTLSATF